MRFTESLMALAAAAAVSFASKLPSDEDLVGTTLAARDASTDMSKLGPPNTDGKNHSPLSAPAGAELKSIRVGGGSYVQTYWTQSPNNDAATSAFITIHGRMRDGNNYWTAMNNILQSAIESNSYDVDRNAIVVAPQFFSRTLNSGQYTDNQMAWDDVNAWQAGEAALTPPGNKATSFDALDVLLAEFANKEIYPNMRNVTIVGQGGGAQMVQRFASVSREPPAGIYVRYIHSGASSSAYFTHDRPAGSIERADCPAWNDWRYGFDKFEGTSEGLASPKEYFRRYISRDVVSMVGLQDTRPNGDQYCMAIMQGGTARSQRNMAWYKYVNMLARTSEDVSRFHGSFDSLPDWSDVSGHRINLRLIVVNDAGHSFEEVFSSHEGRAALFSSDNLPTGSRP